MPNEENYKKIDWHYLYYSGLSGLDYSTYSRLMANTDRAGNLRFGISAERQVFSLAEMEAQKQTS